MDCRLPRSKGVPQINATADVAVKRGDEEADRRAAKIVSVLAK